jgi:hypothetical protein
MLPWAFVSIDEWCRCSEELRCCFAGVLTLRSAPAPLQPLPTDAAAVRKQPLCQLRRSPLCPSARRLRGFISRHLSTARAARSPKALRCPVGALARCPASRDCRVRATWCFISVLLPAASEQFLPGKPGSPCSLAAVGSKLPAFRMPKHSAGRLLFACGSSGVRFCCCKQLRPLSAPPRSCSLGGRSRFRSASSADSLPSAAEAAWGRSSAR